MSDETPVEWLLEGIASMQREAVGDGPEADAIDCGREAIRLLRAVDTLPQAVTSSVSWDVERRALLARCTEGPR